MPDRYSTHLSPSRTPPPAFNRSSTQPAPAQRGSIGPRSSSLTTTPSISTASQSSSGRLQKGSSLRNEVTNVPPDGMEDRLEVVRRILGEDAQRKSSVKSGIDTTGAQSKPTKLITSIDFGGRSLEDFAGITASGGLSPGNYAEEKEKYEDLQHSILACDEVLKSVETYLGNFQTDLASVSAEIETLQSRSAILNTKLENRKVVESHLGPAVEELSISPTVVKKIIDGVIDADYEAALSEVEKRAKAAAKKSADTKVKAYEDVVPLLENLQYKAVERIRDYLVQQIKALRTPAMNAQIIQEQVFIEHKALYGYLARHQKQLASDILQAYVNTMRWYYQSNFSLYEASLRKMKLHTLSKADLLGAEESSSSSNTATKRSGLHGRSNSSANVGIRSLHDAFSVDRRIDLLKAPPAQVLSAQDAEEAQHKNHVEVPFYAYTQALVDNASWEYTILDGLLSPLPGGIITASKAFTSIFEPTFTTGQSLTRHLVDETYDALGILMCIRITQRAAFTLQRRRVPVLENYINATTMLLWPRLQQVMDAHCDSIKQIAAAYPSAPTPSPSSSTATTTTTQDNHLSPLTPQQQAQLLQSQAKRPSLASSASSFLSLSTSTLTSSLSPSSVSSAFSAGGSSNSANNPHQYPQSTAPHPLTQRFARFAASILMLSSPSSSSSPSASSASKGGTENITADNDVKTEPVDPVVAAAEEPVSRSLARLRTEFEGCLFRLGCALVGITDVNLLVDDSSGNNNNNNIKNNGSYTNSNRNNINTKAIGGIGGGGGSASARSGHTRQKSSTSTTASTSTPAAAAAAAATSPTTSRTNRPLPTSTTVSPGRGTGGGGSGGAGAERGTAAATAAAKLRRRDRFLENNYALIATVLEGVEGRMAEEMRGYFEGLRAGIAGEGEERGE